MAEAIGIRKLRGKEGRCAECGKVLYSYIYICDSCGITICDMCTWVIWPNHYCGYCFKRVRYG
jgi:hypothetical protein